MSEARPYHVLFLCTGNSARSIFAEALINAMGRGRFRGFSAGSHPEDQPHPVTLAVLEESLHDVSGLRSKHWSEFSGEHAVPLDFVFTVCDRAAAEPCAVWPSQPITAHWGIQDPVALDLGEAADRDERMKPFRATFLALQQRIALFTNLPLASLDRLAIQAEVDRIGEGGTAQ